MIDGLTDMQRLILRGALHARIRGMRETVEDFQRTEADAWILDAAKRNLASAEEMHGKLFGPEAVTQDDAFMQRLMSLA